MLFTFATICLALAPISQATKEPTNAAEATFNVAEAVPSYTLSAAVIPLMLSALGVMLAVVLACPVML